MNILLTYLCHYADRHDYHISLMPVGLISIAATLEKEGHRVTLANYSQKGYRRALKEIHALKPDIAGVSLFTHNRVDSLKLIQGIRKSLPACKIVVGGPHAAFLADELLKRCREIDYIIRGEGEFAFARLTADLAMKRTPSVRVIESIPADPLDSLPSPLEFTGTMIDIDPNEQFKHIITSRGCPYHCNFCCSPVFWNGKARHVKPAYTMKEIDILYKKHGVIYFSIRDDNFTLRKKHVMEFSERLQKSGVYMMWNCQARVDTADEEMMTAMKRAGLEMIQFGVESGSERILKLYDKSISIASIKKASASARKVGLYLSIYLMTGMTGETHGDVRKTIALIRQILPGDGIVSPVALYPGTRLYEDLRQQGKINNSIWFNSRDSGIYLRNEDQVAGWMGELLTELSLIRDRSWYRAADFKAHRRVVSKDCWVTDILEGDYYLDEEYTDEAEKRYMSVITRHHLNPWGFLRMGKLKFRTGDFAEARECYHEVTRIVPAFYGGWLKLAETQVALGDRPSARKSLTEAGNRNAYDLRIRNLRELLK